MTMAKISKSDRAPADAMHVSLGAVSFDLKDASSVYETNDPSVIANARSTPSLKVVEDAIVAAPDAVKVDALDPHQNPSADHLSAAASDSAISAAASNEQDIKEATGADIQAPSAGPSVTSTVQSTFDVTGVVGAPSFPQVGSPPAPDPVPPVPNPPARAPAPSEVTK